MKSKATLLGHPVHPMLITLPLGLLPAAVLCDLIYIFTHRPFWGEMAYWLIIGGTVGGVVAAVFGTIDWLGIPPNTRAKRVGALHAALNVVVIGVFIISALMRHPDPGHPQVSAALLGALAIVVAVVSAWFGGELVYRLSLGVDEAAHPDASSSVNPKPRDRHPTGV